ncbi:phosphatidate cytidylyltransferase [Anaerobacillus sp. CMMVII]|uniref:phosphatidate cytidylyltransferase n=1 Tax=Anaerobacillus sp. CMMVII TaxID=2755588 RepID=UPI0021B7F078|nr:phosphatidate cytidylyltransferase [Anaerobacillus sp. CMMVII]MCT8139853.1 phosphatidate cytidylyltransferase [Anaerobacillus sp. CMMVII]
MKERIITGVIAGIVFILLIVIGKLPFTIGIILLATIALFELLKMKKVAPRSLIGILSMFFLWTILLPKEWFEVGILSNLNRADLLIGFILLFLAITVLSKNSITFDHIGFIILASAYVGLGFHFLIETRLLENGLALLFFILFLIWGTDSGAYFTGRAFGKRKLWPEISPNKTIEGSLGGVLTALVIGLIYHYFVPISDSLSYLVMIIVAVSVVGQLGDLVESALKRHYAVKDSGSILPGHGGILDRFDSLIFVLPVLYLLHFI